VSVQHENRVLKASDFNYLVSGWLEYPLRARRTNQDDLLRDAQALANDLVKQMNIKRLQKGAAPIVLALDKKKQNLRAKRGVIIEEELALVAKTEPVNLENLAKILADLGHTVVEPKPKKVRKLGLAQKLKRALRASKKLASDRISVIPRGGKKAIRLFKIALIQACYALKKQTLSRELPPNTPKGSAKESVRMPMSEVPAWPFSQETNFPTDPSSGPKRRT